MSLHFRKETFISLKAFNCCGADASHSLVIRSFNNFVIEYPPDLIASETCNFNSSQVHVVTEAIIASACLFQSTCTDPEQLLDKYNKFT